MKKFYVLVIGLVALTLLPVKAQQLPNSDFEDWSGEAFDGVAQPKTWNFSNVTQIGLQFNFAHQEAGHTGKYSAMCQDQEVGAMGITETSPSYISLGQPWVYLSSITAVNQATAGDKGGYTWKYRPDTMQVWIKRTGDNILKEDFHLLYYSWKGTAKSSKYKGKNGNCTSVGSAYEDEESDVRQALNANECGTDVKATQVAEGWWRERKEYGSWTCINVPIYYFTDDVPDKCNVIFSASNYPNFRANSGLYAGNSLYVDDVKMIYSSKIQSLYIGGKKWNGFIPTSTEEQEYSLGESATQIPEIYAMRGQGTLTNVRGQSATFPGRKLTSSECTIKYGQIDGEPTIITVKAEDGSSTTIYKIKFVRAASTNSRLGGIQVNGTDIPGFNAYKFDYNYELPYGTTATPKLTVMQAEDAQQVTITQASSVTGTATVKVVAADKKTTSTYTVKFSVAKLSDNTLKDITIDGESLKGFLPTKNIYTVELPLGTSQVPNIKAVSAYKTGEQTIEYNNQGLDKAFEIKVTAPGNAQSRTYKLNFKITASSYVYLANLQVAGYDISFEQARKIYYVSLPVGTSSIPEVTYTAGDKYQNIVKTTEVDTDNPDRTWVKIVVTAGNGDQLTYKIAFDLMRSDVTTLKGISLDGKPLAGFAPETFRYDVELPIGTTTLPTVTYTKGDDLQTVVVKSSEIDESDYTANTRLTVTADNGDQAVYVINFTIAQANNTTLNMIYVDGKAIEGFAPNTRAYSIVLPLGTKNWPTVTWDKHDEWQTVQTRQGTFNAAKANEMKLSVTSGAGTADTYVLTFTVAEASKNTDLKSISVNGNAIANFSASTYDYAYALPMGTTAVPTVAAEKAEEAQTLTITQAKTVTGKAIIKVVAEDKKTYKNYSVQFSVEQSSNVALTYIAIGGTNIQGFDPEVLEYSIELPAGTTTLPAITYGTDGYQTVSVRNELVNLNGDYKLVVTAPSGATRTYVIHISVVTSSNADLNMIYCGGTALADFNKDKTEYVISLPLGTTTTPAITYEKAEAAQTVTVHNGGLDGTTEIIVRAADGKSSKTYSITFVIEKASNTTLNAIYVGGALLEGFSPEKTNYTYDLTSKTTVLPAVTWQAHDNYQTIVAQTDYMTGLEGDYRIIVRAQTGDTRTYTITFRIVVSSNSQLQSISIGGEVLADFEASKKDYSIELPIGTTVLPEITYVAGDDAQTITLNKGDVNGKTTIVVKAEDGTSSTYTLSFSVQKANITTLNAIYVGGVLLEGFNPETLAYSYDLSSKVTVLPAVTYDAHDAYQTIVAQTDYMTGLEGDYRIIVRAQTGDTRTYTITFRVVVSSNSQLSGISVGGEPLADFEASKKDYSIELPIGTTILPEITYLAGDDAQTITLNKGDVNGKTTIVVKAEDGTSSTYTLNFSVQKADNTTLNAIYVGGELLEGFNPQTMSYSYNLTSKTTVLPAVTWQAHDAYQTIVAQTDYMTGLEGDYRIIVRAQTGDTRTYTITFRVVVSSNSQLRGISIGGEALAGFDSSKKDYSIELPIGTTVLPEITWIAGDDAQTITLNKGDVNGKTTIVVKAEDGTSSTYTLNFKVQKADITTLNAIKLDGELIEGFDPNVTEYQVNLKSTTTVLPVITYEAHDAYQTITVRTDEMNGLTGNYKIVVRAQTGGIRVYTLTFDIVISSNAALADILIDSESYTEYTQGQLDYTYNLPLGTTTAPVISYVAGDEFQTITTNFRGLNGRNEIIVVAQDGTKRTYSITFEVAKSDNTHLAMITIDGKEIEGFAADKLDYTIRLTSDADHGRTEVPAIGFSKVEDEQTVNVVYGSIHGESKVVVVAENGADTRTYVLHFELPVSDNCALSNITLSAGSWSGFSADKAEYDVVLPLMTTELPEINAIKGDQWQKVIIDRGDVEGATMIIVVAENGDRKQYTLNFSVEKSADTQLEWIKIGDTYLAGFNPSIYSYVHYLPEGMAACPEITVKKRDQASQVIITTPSFAGNANIIVTAESGAQSTYKIDIRANDTRSDNCQLASLKINDVTITGFDPLTLIYPYQLPAGSTELPKITYEQGEEHQVVAITRGTVKDTTYIRVLAENKMDFNIYKIAFSVAPYSDAVLKHLYVGNEGNDILVPGQFEYDYVLPKTATSCPLIRPVGMDLTQAIVMSTPVLTGDAVVKVMSAAGGETEYIVHILSSLTDDVTLKSISVAGNPLADFDPEITDYDIDLAPGTTAMPAITWELNNEETQQAELFEGGLIGTSIIRVTAEDGTVQEYTLNLILNQSETAELAWIKLDDALIAGFEGTKLNYDYELPEGTTNAPVVTAQATSPKQNIVIVQPEKTGKALVQVLSEDGITEKTYTVNIHFAQKSDVTLKSIALNGQEIENYDPNTFTYNLVRTTDQMVNDFVLTYERQDATQTVIVENNNGRGAKLYVTAENGSQATYDITYTVAKSNIAQLNGLRFFSYSEDEGEVRVRYTDFADFEPATDTYTYSLPRLTTAVPAIYPVKAYDAQRVTINYGKVNEATTILVEAEDGTSQTYTINFPVTKSSKTALKSLSIMDIDKDVNSTEFEIELEENWRDNYASVHDMISFVAEPEQGVEYVAAPFDKASTIKVTAEDGNVRTYRITFKLPVPEGDNVLKAIAYQYKNAADELIDGTITNPQLGNNIVNLPFGAKSFEITGLTKNYDQQTVSWINAGIRRPSTISVQANKDGVDDAEYMVTPVMPEFETTGKLQDLQFNGATIENFKPYIYNYIVNVTAQPTADDFAFTAYDGKNVTVSNFNAKTKQVTFSVEDGETYSVCWYYAADGNPFDFSTNWIHAAYNGYKPSDKWTIPGDCANDYTWGVGSIKMYYQTGSEVMSSGSNGVLLQTIHGSSLSGSVPGMMTTGSMSLNLNSAGGSSSSVTETAAKGIQYRNTPDSLAFTRKELASSSVTGWSFRLRLSDGATLSEETKVSGTYSQIGTFKYESVPVKLHNNPAVRLTATMNACHTENAGNLNKGLGGTIYTSALQLTDIHFVYNSDLTAATVNGQPTTKSGNTFTYTLAENEDVVGVPVLTFAQKVHDQTRTIEWLNNGEWVEGKLTAKVTNYGENMSDNTVYYVVLQRPAVTDLSIVVNGETLVAEVTDIQKVLPNGTRRLPDLNIVPTSVHQKITLSRKNWAYTITVENENGETATYNYSYVESKSNSTDIAVTMDGINFDVAQTEYEVKADAWAGPLTFVKSSDGQTVTYSNTNDARTLQVVSEDGHKKTYTINCISEQKSSGNLSKVFVNSTSIEPVLAEMNTTEAVTRGVAFIRQEASEAVQQIFAADTVYWTVTANAGGNNDYYLAFEHQKSSETKLKSILVNGQMVKDFDPMVYDNYKCTVEGKSFTLEAEPLDDAATIAIAFNGNLATITVTAEDGTIGQNPYKVAISRQVETNATLKAIYLDGVALANFNPYLMDYSITLPITKPKMAEPVVPAITFEGGADAQTYIVENYGTNVYIEVTAESGAKNTYSLSFTSEAENETSLKALFVNGQSLLQAGHTEYSVVLPNEDEPVVNYYPFSPYQSVNLIPHSSFDEQDQIIVTAENGLEKSYFISYTVDPTYYSAQLKGLVFDGVPYTDFRSDIYSYIIPVENTKSAIPELKALLMNDNQQVAILPAAINETTVINVLAADGKTKQKYEILFQEQKSSDAMLLGISVDYDPIENFDKNIFDYSIEVETDDYTIQAVQSNYAQQVIQVRDGKTTKLIVVAEDGTTNTYSVKVDVTGSALNNAYLSSIIVEGEPIAGFRKDSVFYVIDLPEGTTTLPDFTVVAAAPGQKITFTLGTFQTSTLIDVLAQDGVNSRQYGLRFNVKTSDVDTLKMIYLDGEPLENFDAAALNYSEPLAIGTRIFPYVTFDKGAATQTVVVDTLSSNADVQRLALRVKAADGSKQRTYNLTMTIQKSAVDTLQMIYLGGKPLADFVSTVNDYNVEMPIGSTSYPEISYTPGDDYQTVTVEVQSATAGAATYALRVVAENGTTRVYTLNLTIAESSLTELRNILINGETLIQSGKGYTADNGFSADIHRYNLVWNIGTVDIPQVSYVQGDEYQHVELAHLMSTLNDSVVIRVLAENGDEATYVINSELKHSDVDTLKMIYVDGQPLDDFDAHQEMFVLNLPVGTRNFPSYEAVRGDRWQTISANPVDITTYRAEYAITVIAEAGNKRIYTLIFNVTKSEDNALQSIRINGEPISQNGIGYTADYDFNADQLTYHLNWAVGTTKLPTIDFEAGDFQTLTTLHQMTSLNDSIIVEVAAEAGDVRTYKIENTLQHSTIDTLRNIYVNDLPLEGFNAHEEIILVNLPIGTRNFPPYEAVRGDQWQTITTKAISQSAYEAKYEITVTAEAGNSRVYTLVFDIEKSTDNALQSIRINGEPIAQNGIGYTADYDFNADQLTYHLNWAVGTTKLPTIDFVAGDYQTLTTLHQMTSLNDYVEVEVASEAGDVRTYKVENTLLHSTVDTLRNIYVNSEPLVGFNAHKDTFIVDLPIGTRNVPTYEAVRGDQWQTITTKALSQSSYEAWYEITVTAEAGNTRLYHIGFRIAKSELATLRAIRVNGLNLAKVGVGYTADADFTPEQLQYHLDWEIGTVELPQITYLAGDAYQTVEYLNIMRSVNDSIQIRVTSESGASCTYTIFNNLLHSAVDTLQMIYVNNLPLSNFDAHKDTFIVTLPVGTRAFPTYEAVKGERWQTISQSVLSSTKYEQVIRFVVVAEDGKTTRNYTLIFRIEKSKEQFLNALLVNGELIAEQGKGYISNHNFAPETLNYQLVWEVGTAATPVFSYEVADTLQSVYEIHKPYSANDSLVLRVEAENGDYRIYTVRNTLLHSSVDTLAMIYADNVAIADYRGTTTLYDINLPVGRRSFPKLDYDKGDEYQTVAVDTLSESTYEATYRIRVAAEDGINTRAYTIHFIIAKSAKDNLEAIYLNDKLLSGFAPDVYEYTYQLVADEPVPVITYDMADKYQTVSIIEGTPDGTAYINVTAENGSTKMYTIHFPILRSSNAYLEGITINGKPLEDFDKDQFTYRITLPFGTQTMPIVNYTLAIPAVQRAAIEYEQDNWKATITVTAENGSVNTYELTFTVAKSDNAQLVMITIDGAAIPAFRADSFEYHFVLPYGTDSLPEIAYIKANEQQVVELTENGWSVLITVTSGNGDNTNEYQLVFTVEQNAETRLADLQIFGKTVAGFHPDSLNYLIVYPSTTAAVDLAQTRDILAIPKDSLARVELKQVSSELITITVTAQNSDILVYSLTQRISLPDNALLKAIYVDSTLLKNFDSEEFEYTYLLTEGAVIPSVVALAEDPLAEVSVTVGVIDSIPTRIYCTAQNGFERIYTINFKTAAYNDGETPTARDVLFRHIAGTHSFLAATIRKNVQIGLYDQNGRMLLFENVPTCDPNAANLEVGIDGIERLVSVDDPTEGLVIEVDPAKIYFYVFFEMSKNKLTSGKIVMPQ